MRGFWTEERVAELRRMWTEGCDGDHMTAVLGATSKKAVFNKANRLGLPRRIAERGGKKRRAERPIFAEPVPAYTGEPISILECSDLRCRYPVRDDPFGACGALVKPGKPYCAHHAARCFIPLDDRKKRISRLADLVDAEHSAKRVRA